MDNLLIGLGVGVLGSLIAAFVWMYFGKPIIFSLTYGFPPVAGEYIASYPDNPEWGPESISIKQLGPRISGKFKEPEKQEEYSISGSVISSRMITYQFFPKNKKLNDYGVGLIKLGKDGDSGKGYVLFLSDIDEAPAVGRIIVKSDNKN